MIQINNWLAVQTNNGWIASDPEYKVLRGWFPIKLSVIRYINNQILMDL